MSLLSSATFDNVTLVPESNTGVLAVSALGGLMLLRRRKPVALV